MDFNSVKCSNCGIDIELSEAFLHKLQITITNEQKNKYDQMLKDYQKEVDKQLQSRLAQERQKIELEASSQLQNQVELLNTKIELAEKQRLSTQKELTELLGQLSQEKKARQDAELEMKKKLLEEEDKIRLSAAKEAEERSRLDIASKDKMIADLQKSMAEMQRRASVGSQQLQGEIMELDFEQMLRQNFPDDDILPVAKGVKGGDIKHIVRSPRGTDCGSIIWEIKNTKNWSEGWISKLKDDLRNEKSNIAVLVTTTMPKNADIEFQIIENVFVCVPKMSLTIATLLRKSLLDVQREKQIESNKESKAESLYNFVTSHEFTQSIEQMVEAYQEMLSDITKERLVFEKSWSKRTKQAEKLLFGTANIIGNVQGHIGQLSMPKIKGLELEP